MKHNIFTAHGSRLTAHGSRLTAHGSRLTALVFLLVLSNFLKVNAQCFEPDGMTVRPSFFNIWVAVDQTWVDFYNGDEELAHMAAKGFADDAITLLNDAFAFKTTFRITFIKGFSPSLIAPEFPGSDKTAWCIDVNQFYNNNYPCIGGRDAILLFTKELGSGSDFAYSDVVLVGNPSPHWIAHELGHVFEVTHISTNSSHPNCCTSNKTMMCIPFPVNPLITLLNSACGIDFTWLNTHVFTPSFCSQIRSSPSFFPDDDFECPPVTFSGFNVFSENPNPVIGCKTDGDITTYTLVFTNNSSPTSRNFRVFIADTYSSNLEFVEDPLLDFNCIKVFPNSRTEFWITDPVTPNCDNEKFFLLGPQETKTIKFKVRYLSPIQGIDLSIPLKTYSGTLAVQNYSLGFSLNPTKQIPGGNFSNLLFNDQWHINNPLLITGTVNMNPSSVSGFNNTYNFATNKKLYFAPGAGLEIAPNNTVKMPHIEIEGCSTMWKGITVRDGATLEMNMMTSVKDAQYAVNVQKGGTVNVQSCKFVDNNYAITTSTLGSGNHDLTNLTLLGNDIQTSESGLKPNYSGQSPAAGTKGFAGIYVKDFTPGLSIDKDAIFGLENEFSNLHYGILAENTNVTVRDADFTDIIKETRPANYPGPLFTGSAVHLTKGNADVKGSYASIAPDPVVMDNCHTGINVLGGSIDVAGCEMGNMTNGIIAGGGGNKAYNIYWNNISASERGIAVFYQSGLPGQSSIDNNIVHMVGNPKGVGIANGGQEMFPQQEGFVVNNNVTMEEGATGIQIGVANRIKVTQNTVNLSGSGTLFGIKIEGGDRNVLNCNSILGTGGDNDGIYAVHASRASVLCNQASGPTRGLHFEGMLAGKNKADIGGNTMEDNTEAGLLLGTDAVIGGQVHRGNKWEGTAAIAGIEADFHSKFTVDANENPDFLPDAWIPFAWFLDLAIPSPSFDCGFPTTCPPLPALIPDYSLDIKIVRGELGGTTYQAANQWLSQRRFYELVIEEGNPYPGNSDVSTFLSQAQANGLSGYANVQVGIRQLGAMSESSRATAAANLWTLNNALTGNASYQVNEKLVNQIFLQTVAIGNLEFSEIQISSLEGIAELCPLSYGEAVLRARAMLQLVQGTQIDYDDISICGGGERSENNKMAGQSSIRVYPNPANDVLSIDYQGIGDLGGQFQMFNVQGQTVRNITLPSNQGIVQLILNGLSSGIYFYSVSGVTEGKVFIQR